MNNRLHRIHAEMSPEDGPILQSLKQSTLHYTKRVETLDLEQLRRQPAPEEWSLGQMLLHLAESALYTQLANARRCLEETSVSPETSGLKTEIGEAFFQAGSFPPTRIRVPASPQYTPKQPEDKAQILAALESVIEKVQELEPRVARFPAGPTEPHPGLGNLNAQEWLKLTEMHYRHHLLQEERLAAWLCSER